MVAGLFTKPKKNSLIMVLLFSSNVLRAGNENVKVDSRYSVWLTWMCTCQLWRGQKLLPGSLWEVEPLLAWSWLLLSLVSATATKGAAFFTARVAGVCQHPGYPTLPPSSVMPQFSLARLVLVSSLLSGGRPPTTHCSCWQEYPTDFWLTVE